MPFAKLFAPMFLKFFTLGTVVPGLTLYLVEELKFSGVQVGTILSLTAGAAAVSLVITSWIAERLISTKTLYLISLTGTALTLFLMSVCRGYLEFTLVYTTYSFFSIPGLGLINSICFRLLGSHNKHHFSRLWMGATIGWILAALIYSYLWLVYIAPDSGLSGIFAFSGFGTVLLIALVWTLPATEAEQQVVKRFFPKEAFDILRQPVVIYLLALIAIASFLDRYMLFGLGPFLQSLGVAEQNILPIMSIGQISEIFMLFNLAKVIRYIGIRWTVVIGALVLLLRFAFFFVGTPLATVIVGIACHGLAFGCFITAIRIHTEHYTTDLTRSSIHLVSTLLSFGVAGFLSVSLAGYVFDHAKGDFALFWLPCLALAALLVLLVLFCPVKKVADGE